MFNNIDNNNNIYNVFSQGEIKVGEIAFSLFWLKLKLSKSNYIIIILIIIIIIIIMI